MKKSSKTKKTTVGEIDSEVLAFTAGRDIELDRALVHVDCIGSAAHVTMLSRMPLKPKLLSRKDAASVIAELVAIMKRASAGRFEITPADQDVHLAVERALTEKLGDLGKKIHTGRSRNDQVALDLRLYGREQLLHTLHETAELAAVLVDLGERHKGVPMVGRTHMQPAMPSSVGLWATAWAEELLDNTGLLIGAFEMNDKSPLGSAAGYGVPLPIDRELVADLLGFSGVCHNVLYAGNSRGKMESVILSAMNQVMMTLSRIAQDLMLFTMPEFGYFSLPTSFCTGSSIMPQKKNPDVCELIRARASLVQSGMVAACELVKGAPSGYNRDLQEAKGVFMDGIGTTRSSLRIMRSMLAGMKVNREALMKGFTPDVFATDRAVELVSEGMPFRDAYHHVKEHLDELGQVDPVDAIGKKTHTGATAGLNFAELQSRVAEAGFFASQGWEDHCKAVGKLLGVSYPIKNT